MNKAVNLARHLRSQIEAGQYPVGSAFPTEGDLQRRYDVSRHTVREALRELKERGLISSRAGIGTTVRAQTPPSSFMHGVGTLEELIQYGEALPRRVLASEAIQADPNMAEDIGAKEGQALHRISLLRYRSEESLPAGLVSIFLRPEHADVISDIGAEPVIRLVERRFHLSFSEIVQLISARVLTRSQARTLACPAGHPALRVIRQYRDAQDRLLAATDGLYPADRFSHNTRFRIRHEPAPGDPI